MQTEFSRTLGIEVPLICGAMYPCSNPELVAAVSAAGGIGVLQPLSLVYVCGLDFRTIGCDRRCGIDRSMLRQGGNYGRGAGCNQQRCRQQADCQKGQSTPSGRTGRVPRS